MRDIKKMIEQENISGHSSYGYYHMVRVQGASHVKHDQPCQDAFAYLKGEKADDPFIVAVADGHGDKRYDMSRYGSKLATEVAVRTLKELYEQQKGSKTYLFRSFRDNYAKDLIREWRKSVLHHAEENGLEIAGPSEVYTRYGTTLLVALVSKDEILLGQLGDGDMLIIDDRNKPVVPFPQEEELVGNATYSLTSTEANRFWKAARMDYPNEQAWLMLSTDGLANCFEDDENFHRFVGSLFKYVRASRPSLMGDQLPPILFDYSEKGSGDDITVSLLELKGSSPSKTLNISVDEGTAEIEEEHDVPFIDNLIEKAPRSEYGEPFFQVSQKSNIFKPLNKNASFQEETNKGIEEFCKTIPTRPVSVNITHKPEKEPEQYRKWLERSNHEKEMESE